MGRPTRCFRFTLVHHVAFVFVLLPGIGCHPGLTREFYNNTGRPLYFPNLGYHPGAPLLIACAPGDRYQDGMYWGDIGSREVTVLFGEEAQRYWNIYGKGDAHLRLLPVPIPGMNWIIRFQIEADGSMRLIPKGQSFPLPVAAPQPEGFPKVPVEQKPLTTDERRAIRALENPPKQR